MIAEAWTSNDWMAAQTIVMGLTGLIVAWYTWKTHQLREDTVKQNNLIAGQLQVMRESLDLVRSKENRESQPFLRMLGGRGDDNKWEQDFENQGGEITSISVWVGDGASASAIPANHIQQLGKGVIKIERGKNPLPRVFRIETRCLPALGDLQRKSFNIDRG